MTLWPCHSELSSTDTIAVSVLDPTNTNQSVLTCWCVLCSIYGSYTHTWPVAHRSEFTYVCQRVNYFTDGTVTGVILLVFGVKQLTLLLATVVTKT